MKNSWKANFALVLIVVYIFSWIVYPATSYARVEIHREAVFGEPGGDPNGSISYDTFTIDPETAPVNNSNSSNSLDETRYSWWLLSLRFTLNQVVGFII